MGEGTGAGTLEKGDRSRTFGEQGKDWCGSKTQGGAGVETIF